MVGEESRTVLVVDDHEEVRDSLDEYLQHSGFRTLKASNASEARVAVGEHAVDLVVLDIMMPGEDGISLCRHLREVRALPVVFLTAKNGETDRIVGMEVGADDYVVKPFSPRELLARIKAILGRLHAMPPGPSPIVAGSLVFGQWQLHRRQKRLVSHCGSHRHELTGSEYELLMTFLRHPRRVLTRDELLESIHRQQSQPFDRTIDNQVSRLRKKVEQDPSRPRIIRTVWGRGYCLDVDVDRQTG